MFTIIIFFSCDRLLQTRCIFENNPNCCTFTTQTLKQTFFFCCNYKFFPNIFLCKFNCIWWQAFFFSFYTYIGTIFFSYLFYFTEQQICGRHALPVKIIINSSWRNAYNTTLYRGEGRRMPCQWNCKYGAFFLTLL